MLDYFSQTNIFNKLLLLIALYLLVLHWRSYKDWSNTWNWMVSVSDPYLYPMVMERSYFTDPKTEYWSYLFKEVIPMNSSIAGPYDKKGIRADWGKFYRNDWIKERLPETMHLSWYSVREDLHYKGTFDLPIELIKKYFKKGYKSHGLELRQRRFQFIIGIAPKGKIVVWLKPFRHDAQFEIATYTAAVDNEIELDEARKKAALEVLKPEELKAVEEAIKNKEPIPEDYWQGDLRKQYNYRIVPQLSGGAKLLNDFEIYQINGEVKWVNIADGKYHKAALPKKIITTSYNSIKDMKDFDIAFKEADVLKIFESVSADAMVDIYFHFNKETSIVEVYVGTNKNDERVQIMGLEEERD